MKINDHVSCWDSVKGENVPSPKEEKKPKQWRVVNVFITGHATEMFGWLENYFFGEICRLMISCLMKILWLLNNFNVLKRLKLIFLMNKSKHQNKNPFGVFLLPVVAAWLLFTILVQYELVDKNFTKKNWTTFFWPWNARNGNFHFLYWRSCLCFKK